MRNLLYLTHRLPFPPNKGDKVRSYHLLKYLARDHRVFLGTFVDDPEDVPHVIRLENLCAQVHAVRLDPKLARLRSLTGLLTGEALTLPYYRNRDLAAWVTRTVAEHEIDTAVVFSSPMAQYLDGLPDVRVLVDFVDVDSAKWSEYAGSRHWPWSWIYAREGERLLAAERAIAGAAQRSFFVTSAEAALFRRLAPESADKVEAISNGVDADYFSQDPQRPTPYRDDEITIVFTGAMDYWPNVDAVTWFAAEVLPALRARRPNVRFYIVGMRPAPAVQALAGDAVVVTGAVPDVRPYVQHAAVAVAPLRVARGIQNKVLEAMAMSAAVVTSKACARAIEGVTPGEVVGAQGAAAFVNSVEALLADRPRALSLGESARRFVLEHYSWQRRLERMGPYLEGGRAPAQPAVAAPHASEEALQ